MSEQTVDTGAETKSGRKVAEHSYLDAAGNVVETEEQATGIRYHIISTGDTFDFQTGGKPGEPLTMLAVFGAKTLATNEASAFKQSTKSPTTPNGHYDGAIDAISERFKMIESGTFVDRSRDGVGGPKWDLDALAEAMCIVLVSSGEATQEQIDRGGKAKVREKLESKEWLAKAKKNPAVVVEYQRLAGKSVTSAAELASGFLS